MGGSSLAPLIQHAVKGSVIKAKPVEEPCPAQLPCSLVEDEASALQLQNALLRMAMMFF